MKRKTLLACLLMPAVSMTISAQNYPIGQISTTLTDAYRNNRQVGVEIFYPATAAGTGTPVADGNGENFPLIVLGHGFSMTYDAYSNFWNEFVPKGYILVLPKTETGPIPFPSHGEFANDLNFIISYFQLENAKPTSPFYQKYSGKVAVMGHSMGGGCTFLAGSNPAITTVIGFAPAETNPSAIAAAADVTAPALVFVGSKDNVAGAAGNATPIYNALNSSCKTFINITDASHCGFAESNFLCEFGETTVCAGCSFIARSQQHAITFQFLNPWLRFFLKGDCPQWDLFQDLLASTSGITHQQTCGITAPVAQFSVQGSAEFCAGDSVVFSASGDYDFLWSNGETDRNITITSGGAYNLVVTDEWNCKDTSATEWVSVLPWTQPAIQYSGDLNLCEGESLTLSVDGYYTDYLWSTNSTDSATTVSWSGSYFVNVTDSNGCSGTSDTITVSVNSTPEASIQLINDTLYATGDGSVQWYLDGALLAGESNNYLVPDAEGWYEAVITHANGCADRSESVYFTFTAINSASSFQQKSFYPNPTNGMIFFKYSTVYFSLFNAYGKKLKDGSGQALDLAEFPVGIYILKADDVAVRVVKY